VRRTTELQTGDQFPLDSLAPKVDERVVLSLQRLAAFIRVDDTVADYAVRIVRATRQWPACPPARGRAAPSPWCARRVPAP
jgi:MoxR-like ATPase